MYNIVTETMTHFDCRDIEDLINSRKRWDDYIPTRFVYSNDTGKQVDEAPEIEWKAIQLSLIDMAGR